MYQKKENKFIMTTSIGLLIAWFISVIAGIKLCVNLSISGLSLFFILPPLVAVSLFLAIWGAIILFANFLFSTGNNEPAQ